MNACVCACSKNSMSTELYEFSKYFKIYKVIINPVWQMTHVKYQIKINGFF